MNHSRFKPEIENNFYYFVLNLNKGASLTEINERYRSLSLIFHPDKHRDVDLKEVATKKFLEIQKAYQVLSDPYLREIYDILGERGLTIKWNIDLRMKSSEEVRRILLQTKNDMEFETFRRTPLRSTTTCLVDASSLFDSYFGSDQGSLRQKLLRRAGAVRMHSFSARYFAKKSLNDTTSIGIKTRIGRNQANLQTELIGAIRHQFSPRLTAEADLGILWPHLLRLKSSFNENGNSLVVTASSLLGVPSQFSVMTISASRRLFRHRFDIASFEVAAGLRPRFAFNLVSPAIFGVRSINSSEEPVQQSAAPSVSGLEVGTTHRKLGLVFDSLLPSFVAEWGVNLAELNLNLKFGMQYGLTDLSLTWAGTWSNSNTSFTLACILDSTGVTLRTDFDYLHQQLALPIFVSAGPRLDVALWVTIFPSTALILGYHLIIKPRRHRQRLEHIRTAKRVLQEHSSHQTHLALVSLLSDSARKSRCAESAKEGLVITEATYGPQLREDCASDLAIDVSLPLQSLVRSSQLYISADHPRWEIPGIIDPAPSIAKLLSIRYLFGGRTHFAEIVDESPVVLPLAEHLIE